MCNDFWHFLEQTVYIFMRTKIFMCKYIQTVFAYTFRHTTFIHTHSLTSLGTSDKIQFLYTFTFIHIILPVLSIRDKMIK